MRGSARPEWFRCRFRVFRWRLIDHEFRDEFGGFTLPEEAGDGSAFSFSLAQDSHPARSEPCEPALRLTSAFTVT